MTQSIYAMTIEENDIVRRALLLLKMPSCKMCKHITYSKNLNKRIYSWCHSTDRVTSDTAVMKSPDERGWCEFYEKA